MIDPEIQTHRKTFTHLKVALWVPLCLMTGHSAMATDVPLRLEIRRTPHPVLQWPSQPHRTYHVEVTPSLGPATWQTLAAHVQGTGGLIAYTNFIPSNTAQFYRVVVLPEEEVISPDVIFPQPGLVYDANTLLGAAALGLQYRIPPAWKAGIREGSSTMILASDTEPGLVLGVLTLAGDGAFITGQLPAQFPVDDFGGFEASQTVAVTDSRIVGEWTGVGSQQGAIMRLQGVLHPSGGMLGFFGLFTPPNRLVMQQTLESLVSSTLTVRRQTDQTWVDGLRGKAFKWVAYKSTGSGGTSGSLSRWSDNNAFFCDATYEITRYSESSFSGSLSGGGFYTGGGSSSSTEAGDWTVVRTANGPVLILLSGDGIQAAFVTQGPSGNSFYFGDQEFSVTGAHTCF